jgi:DNA-binding MarR family transcriptional regulator
MQSIEVQIVMALRRISQAIDIWSRQLWQEYGLTSPQLATLREILEGQNVSPGTLANVLHLSQPTVTGILGRLEQRGLIRRERSTTDRRSITAIATPEGKLLADKAPPLLRDRFRRELVQLPEDEQNGILLVLERVARMMHAPQLEEGPFLFNEPTPRRSSSAGKKRGTEQPASSDDREA